MSFVCKYCNKDYSSRQSRWNHIKTCRVSQSKSDSTTQSKSKSKSNGGCTFDDIDSKTFKCTFCNKVYKHKQSKYKHEKTCENKNKETTDLKAIEKQNEEMRIQLEELKMLIQKSLKIHPRTLQKINKQLNNSGTINNNNITNNINFLVQLGFENLNEALSEKEKINILMSKAHGLREIINLVHISDKYKQFNNVYITNLQNSIGYKYDTKTNNFIAVNKSELLDDIIECRMIDIEIFYSNLEDKLDAETAKIVKRFINRMNDENDPLKGLKKEEIKLLLYNSRDKILDKKKEIEI
jgi:hypothetical protein